MESNPKWFLFIWINKTMESRQIPINDTLEILFKDIRKNHGFKSKYVFLYDGQIIEAKSGKARKPKENAEAKPVKEIKRSFNSVFKKSRYCRFQISRSATYLCKSVIIKRRDPKRRSRAFGP